MSTPHSVISSSIVSPAKNGGIRVLQERLHELLSRIADVTDVVKNWSEAADDSVHYNTTSKLIKHLLETIKAIERVEGVVKTDDVLRKSLQDCPIPLDLLELMEHGGGLNPDCFSQELLRGALGQLAGLKRRKLALERLGAAVEAGLKKRELEEAANEEAQSKKKSTESAKRKREEDTPDDGVAEPPAKKSS
mmetsp:Transcript_21157/g.29908  ORF Transcript_21157/g.29908 Transcript_21157/m.29908 type:complete len:192 (-) Transcript_21157:1203-1778(-)